MLWPIYIYWLKYKCDHLKRAHFGSNFTSPLIFILFLIIRLNLFFLFNVSVRIYLSFWFFIFFLFNIFPLFRSVAGKLFCDKKRNILAGILHSSKYLFGVFLFAVHFYNDVTTLSNWALFLFSSHFFHSIITSSQKYKQGIFLAIKLVDDILRTMGKTLNCTHNHNLYGSIVHAYACCTSFAFFSSSMYILSDF